MPRNWDDEWYEPSRPLPAKDGIKAKNVRGAFGTSWWAKRWLAVLESFGWGSRLTRGRSYARQGQVLNIELQAGQVSAKVQGSRATPYKVKIQLPPLSDAQWERAVDGMATQALFAARLLASEMPQSIEDAFGAADVPLFPQSARDVATDCSCPDPANPCKHIAAVYYLLGERFDEDPFLLFQLRGRTREQIVEALRARRASATDEAPHDLPTPAEAMPRLEDLLDRFYQAGSQLDTVAPRIAAPEMQAGILRRMGAPPADTEGDLRAIYQAMTSHVLNKVFGDE